MKCPLLVAIAAGSLVLGPPAHAATLACSSSILYLGANPIADGTDSHCTSAIFTAWSLRSFGFQDSGDPGQGNWSASGGIRAGAFAGSVHVSLADLGVVETSYASQSVGQLFDGMTVHAAALAGTAGTLEVPVHVTGGFIGSSENVPTAAPAPPPTISGSFRLQCAGNTFAGGCGDQTVSFDVDTGGPASQPLDENFTMTMPVVFGQPLAYNATFTLTTGLLGTHCINCGVETWMSGNVDASAGGSFGAAIVRDGSGDVVAGATITSDSGYDYTVAPEPAEEELGLAAIGCVGAVGCRPRVRRAS